MIGGSLMTIEAIRDQRFPMIKHGEQRNPPVPSVSGGHDYRRAGRPGIGE
jgi:hypothetical protein